MPKNIIIFSDGTGQEGGIGNNTNIYKMFNMVEDRTDRQIAFYDPGLGLAYPRISGKLMGVGISKNVRECYKFIFDNFKSGDQIFLFGFSRGAATVRSLSGFIHTFGILPQCRPELIKIAYEIYRIEDKEKREQKAREFLGNHHNMWTKIKFLGCFDTVTALSVPFKWLNAFVSIFRRHKFHNLELSESVEYARHALALDENRKHFPAALWDPEKNKDRLKQVWFSGVHSDIGGGYLEHGLSDIALNWMVNEAKEKGLLIYPGNQVEYKIKDNVEDIMHDEYAGIFKLSGKVYRKWDQAKYGQPELHPSTSKRTKNRENLDAPKYKISLI